MRIGKWKTHKTNGNSSMTNFMARCFRSPGAPTNSPERLVRSLVRLVAWCSTWCMVPAKSPALDNNLKHCHQTIIESIVQRCIALFKINMHELFILLLTLFLIYLINFLFKTPLVYLINIIIIIFFLNFLDIAYYLLH